MIILHDGNTDEFVCRCRATNLCGMAPRHTVIGSLPYARPYAEVMDLIPESQWASRYEAMIGKFARQKLDSFNPLLHNQGPHPLCWAYSFAQHCENARAKMGLPYIQLSPESVTGTAGYRDVGWYLDKTLDWAIAHGIAPKKMVPQYNLRPSTWGEGWQEAALNVVPLEIFDLGTKNMWAEVVTALLTGDAVYIGYNWLGHAMNMEELQMLGTELCPWLRNTWGAGQDMVVSGKRKVPNEAYVVRQVTYAP